MDKRAFYSFVVLVNFVFFVGCGKRESEEGTTGTIIGAATGAALTNKKYRGTGMLLGGLIGNVTGRLVGAKEDQKEEKRGHKRQLGVLAEENRILQQAQERWCGNCVQRVAIKGAQSCPICGDELIYEKICSQCSTVFSPAAGYRYCPYCRNRILLTSR